MKLHDLFRAMDRPLLFIVDNEEKKGLAIVGATAPGVMVIGDGVRGKDALALMEEVGELSGGLVGYLDLQTLLLYNNTFFGIQGVDRSPEKDGITKVFLKRLLTRGGRYALSLDLLDMSVAFNKQLREEGATPSPAEQDNLKINFKLMADRIRLTLSIMEKTFE